MADESLHNPSRMVERYTEHLRNLPSGKHRSEEACRQDAISVVNSNSLNNIDKGLKDFNKRYRDKGYDWQSTAEIQATGIEFDGEVRDEEMTEENGWYEIPGELDR